MTCIVLWPGRYGTELQEDQNRKKTKTGKTKKKPLRRYWGRQQRLRGEEMGKDGHIRLMMLKPHPCFQPQSRKTAAETLSPSRYPPTKSGISLRQTDQFFPFLFRPRWQGVFHRRRRSSLTWINHEILISINAIEQCR